MLPEQSRSRRSRVFTGIFVAIMAIAGIAVTESAHPARATVRVGALSASNASISAEPIDVTSTCSAEISGAWSGTLAFQVRRPGGNAESATAQSFSGAPAGPTTRRSGIFLWRAPSHGACQVTMLSHGSGTATVGLQGLSSAVAQIGTNYVTWYNTPSPWPSPITSAYVGIGGALGAGNIYNTATNGHGTAGTDILGTGLCAFLCYGARGVASSNVLAVGNDVSSPSPNSFTTLGAPDDCTTSSAPFCPGGITDEVFAIEYYASSSSTPVVYVAIDRHANFAVASGLYAGAAIVAGASVTSPEPSPSPGSLVSNTSTAMVANTGDVLLGSVTSYVKCDYGETLAATLSCNKPFVVGSGATSAGINTTGIVWATGGVQPNGTSGAYAPEALPEGANAVHPKIITGNCSVSGGSGMCTFTNGFADTSYECTVSAQGTSGAADSYVKMSKSEIVIYSLTSTTFSYMCME
jgi:hypothetical protein